jgi:hypothetical protein
MGIEEEATPEIYSDKHLGSKPIVKHSQSVVA